MRVRSAAVTRRDELRAEADAVVMAAAVADYTPAGGQAREIERKTDSDAR
jgi:phosphopantothenoylcysteine synthetase/decarboxylase